MRKNDIAKNLSSIKKEIKNEIKNDHQDTQLVAVTKYSPVEDVIMAYEANHFDFGENRVSDLEEKAAIFKNQHFDKVRWHFIGHLQSNKVRELLKIPNLYAIHSVDSLRLLEELLKREQDFSGKELKIFFQVNTSHEDEKSGFESVDELKMAVEILSTRVGSKFKLVGLMTMGTIRTTDFETEALRCFRDLNLIAQNLEKSFGLKSRLKLSMGMSQDFKLAIMAGSDYIRVGSAIFK